MLPSLPENLGVLAAGPCLYDTVVDNHGGMYITKIGFDFLDPLVDPVANGVIFYINMDGKSSVVAEDLYFPIGIAGAGHRALLVKEGGVICTSDSNDPVLTRQVPGATIDIAEVRN